MAINKISLIRLLLSAFDFGTSLTTADFQTGGSNNQLTKRNDRCKFKSTFPLLLIIYIVYELQCYID